MAEGVATLLLILLTPKVIETMKEEEKDWILIVLWLLLVTVLIGHYIKGGV